MTRRSLAAVAILAAMPMGALGVYYYLREVRTVPTATPVPDAGVPNLGPGLPGQGIAFTNILHKKHVEGVNPVECTECHQYEPKHPGVRHRCLRCHENNWSALHAGVGNDKAAECLSCHDFAHLPSAAHDPWSCATCHVQGAAAEKDDLGPHLISSAPKVFLHAQESCADCHRPHGASAVVPRNCTECHAKEATKHNTKNRKNVAMVCLDCHEMHERTGSAVQKCRQCHQRIDFRATFASGHQTCTTCHKPHNFTKKTVEDCKDCHRSQPTLAATTNRAHARCQSCHKPHSVGGAEKSCQSSGCHNKVHVGHPADPKEGTCLGCHVVHPRKGAPTVGTNACITCHGKGKTMASSAGAGASAPPGSAGGQAFHAPSTKCLDCHEPHSQKKMVASAALCRTCHNKKIGKAEPIRVARGHANCNECHEDAAHDPRGKRPECKSCHAEQQKTAPKGHQNCQNCHRTHNGKLKVGCTSAGCHKNHDPGGAHSRIAGGCATCHRPHGPKGRAAPPSCTQCHDDKRLPNLHQVAQHSRCKDCHQAHNQKGLGQRNSCLASCHQDKKNHEPQAESCVTCHPFEGDNALR